MSFRLCVIDDDDDLQNACFSSLGRPPAIGVWFKSGKKFRNFTPKELSDADVGNLHSTWPRWWSTINPDWRLRDENHTIVLGREETGNWSVLDKHGQCGLLSVIMCLVWWAQSISDKSQWLEATKDVLIALRGLNKGNRTRGVRRKRPEVEETDEVEPSKRRQTRGNRT
ncbi:hypothetical protein VKT23_019548 [Stygiomarasmius scandens]|uniref:Uncharacterized protein n=1 Tax=Marasmiellus scandens TaxID=2682957 RepID=A0ABR1IMQ8_9AGAR